MDRKAGKHPVEEHAISLFALVQGCRPALALAPLLAALLACVDVQADLDEKRDAFWRSKPVRVESFIVIKFLCGLLPALLVIACPTLLIWGLTVAHQESLPDRFARSLRTGGM